MTAAIAASGAAAGDTHRLVTVGQNGTAFGYSGSPSFGSIDTNTLYGAPNGINLIQCVSTTTTLVIGGSVLPQGFFRHVTFKFGTGGTSSLTLLSANASYTNPGGNTSQWQWISSATFSATDLGLARRVIFYR